MADRDPCPDCGTRHWNYDKTICLMCNPPVVSERVKKKSSKRKKPIDYRDHYYHEWIKSRRDG